MAHLVLIVIIALAAIGGLGYLAWTNMNKEDSSGETAQTPAANQEAVWPMDEDVLWENTSEGSWAAIEGDTPACPDPLRFEPPTPDLRQATALLYPGQERRGSFEGQGGNYKPHGGFRFDNAESNKINVTMPFDGYVYRGSAYLTDGEIQYTFDIINPCGIMVRLGHLRALSPEFQAIADKFPEARENDSRTERVLPKVAVRTGDVVATEIGLKDSANAFFDWGVFDLRTTKEAAKEAAYRQAHADNSELAWHGVCWLDMLDSDNAAFVKGLPPADPDNGRNSDYCK
jgi:hypothetical protein